VKPAAFHHPHRQANQQWYDLSPTQTGVGEHHGSGFKKPLAIKTAALQQKPSHKIGRKFQADAANDEVNTSAGGATPANDHVGQTNENLRREAVVARTTPFKKPALTSDVGLHLKNSKRRTAENESLHSSQASNTKTRKRVQAVPPKPITILIPHEPATPKSQRGPIITPIRGSKRKQTDDVIDGNDHGSSDDVDDDEEEDKEENQQQEDGDEE
jgi:hypothetical protein